MPPDFEVYKKFEENLNYMGFSDVVVISPTFHYRFIGRILNFFQKHLFNNRKYKKQLIDTDYTSQIYKRLEYFSANSIDYALIIRPDKLDNKTIEKIHFVANKVVAYQWDGLLRFPKVFELIPLFKYFFVFDNEDFIQYKEQYPNLLLCSNFYFDIPENEPFINNNGNKVIYVGMYIDNRVSSLLKIVDKLSEYNNIELNINVFYSRKTPPFLHPQIKFSSKGMVFSDYLSLIQNSSIILDIKTEEHNGLSFRIFEAIKYGKKLITNNKAIKQYDFYHPNNFFIFDDDDFQGLKDFLDGKYIPPSNTIRQKYSFSNWVKNLLDMPPYITF